MVALDLPMPAERIYAHPAVRMDAGRVALKRGPLVYCVEEVDNPRRPVQRLKLPRGSEIKVAAARRSVRRHRHAHRRCGQRSTTAIGATGSIAPSRRPSEPATLTALPYYLWNNRQKGSMMVWLVEA